MIARLPAGVVVLVALGSAVSVAVAALPVVTRMSAADQVWTAATRPVSEAEPTAQRADLSPILDLAPFGRPVSSDAPAVQQTAAPSSLTLQGISTSPDPAASRAIIATGDGPTASYAIGDSVAPGQTLTTIAADHVLLTLDGQSQRLDFPTAPLTSPAPEPDGSLDLQNLIPTTQPEPAGLTQTIQTLRDKLQRNPQAVLDLYDITATGTGYLLGDNTPPQIVQAGLQPGDLITDLNGQKVGTLLADRSHLDQVAASGQAEIVLMRSGATVSLSVPLQ